MLIGKRIGIIGGSFDPPHLGHLHFGWACRDAYGLDTMLYICAKTNPHKHMHHASWQHRLSMLALMLRDEASFFVSLVDLLCDGPSYTYRSLQLLYEWYGLGQGGQKPYYFIGDDVAVGFTTWEEYEDILDRVRIVAVCRDLQTLPPLPFAYEGIEIDALPISSSIVRRCIAQHENVGHLLVPAVHKYIIYNNLYRT